MAKMPQELITFLESTDTRIVVSWVGNNGDPNLLPKGKLTILDDETIAFADRSNIALLTDFKPHAKAAVHASTKEEKFGYLIKGTFQEYRTSGPIFDQWAGNMGGPAGNLVRMGVIKVDEVYAFVNHGGGKRIV